MVLEIVNSCLVHQTQHNPNLIYALLYKRELFEAAGLNPGKETTAAKIGRSLIIPQHSLTWQPIY